MMKNPTKISIHIFFATEQNNSREAKRKNSNDARVRWWSGFATPLDNIDVPIFWAKNSRTKRQNGENYGKQVS